MKNIEEVKLTEVSPVDLEKTEDTAERIEIEAVDYKDLNKEQLVQLLESKDKTIDNYATTKADIEKAHTDELTDLNNYYAKKIQELNSLIKYYERKCNILRDVLNIEAGDEK